jgi:uncharacterized protein YggE
MTDDLRLFEGSAPPASDQPGDSAEAPQPTCYATSAVTIQLRNAERALELQTTFGGSEAPYPLGQSPVYSLLDDTAARRTARSQAIAAARADAEAYAAALNLRISRVLRVTERGGLDFLSMLVSEGAAARQIQWHPFAASEAQVPTYAVVGVDFVLVPQ